MKTEQKWQQLNYNILYYFGVLNSSLELCPLMTKHPAYAERANKRVSLRGARACVLAEIHTGDCNYRMFDGRKDSGRDSENCWLPTSLELR